MSIEEQKTAYKSDKNSLCYWYPKIKELNIPTPRTIIIPLTREEGLNWLEGKQDLSKQVRHNIETMAKVLETIRSRYEQVLRNRIAASDPVNTRWMEQSGIYGTE